jgi:hypothetical protein
MKKEDITILPFQLEGLENSFTVLTPTGIKTFKYKTKEDMERNRARLIKLISKK